MIAFVVPFVSGTQMATLFGLDTIQAMFMGLLLSITAIPVSAVVLMEFGVLKSKMGNTIITAAVINDILSLIVLAILLQMSDSDGTEISIPQLGISLSKIGIFIAEIVLLAFIVSKTEHWLPHKIGNFFERLQSREAIFGILLVLTIIVSLVAHYTGLHFIVGTFFAGLIFGKMLIRKEADRAYGIVSGITFGFFMLIFFAFIGIEMDLRSMTDSIPLFVALLAVAIATKIGGGYLGARIVRFSNNDSIAVGCLMNGRGMIELAIASIGYAAGILDATLFSIAVAIGFITTILAPVLSRPFISRAKAMGSSSVQELS